MENEEGSRRPARVEPVDNWSDRWKATVRMLDEIGQLDVLRLDEEGWLPARQLLLVAFAGERAVGYISFSVHPVIREGAVLTEDGRAVMEAVVDGEGTVDGEHAVVRQLREAAMHRALELRCARFRWECAGAGV
jgi:hypothetical protein